MEQEDIILFFEDDPNTNTKILNFELHLCKISLKIIDVRLCLRSWIFEKM